MLRLCRANKYFPLRIGNSDATSGPRIGGRPPEGVLPSVITAHTRYFATLPLYDKPELEVSIFTSIASRSDDDFCISYHSNEIKTEVSSIVQFVHHPFSHRSQKDGFNAEYSAQSLIIGEETAETFSNQYVGHRIGGTPFILGYVGEGVSKILTEGYVHFVQFAYPVPDDAGEGEWVLGNFSLSVFAKAEGRDFRFRYVFT